MKLKHRWRTIQKSPQQWRANLKRSSFEKLETRTLARFVDERPAIGKGMGREPLLTLKEGTVLDTYLT